MECWSRKSGIGYNVCVVMHRWIHTQQIDLYYLLYLLEAEFRNEKKIIQYFNRPKKV